MRDRCRPERRETERGGQGIEGLLLIFAKLYSTLFARRGISLGMGGIIYEISASVRNFIF